MYIFLSFIIAVGFNSDTLHGDGCSAMRLVVSSSSEKPINNAFKPHAISKHRRNRTTTTCDGIEKIYQLVHQASSQQ